MTSAVHPAKGRRGRAAAASAVLLLPTLLGLALALSPPAGASTVSLTLYTTTGGWGLSSSNITSPGPTITVNEGDIVQLSLNGADNAWHNFYVDYNGNGNPDSGSGEPLSQDFRKPTATTLSFTADVAGNFTYYCEYHWQRAYGDFIVVPAPPGNTAPSALLLPPVGVAAWTGGSVHNISWNQTDLQEPPSNLTAWVNYTSSAASGPALGPVNGTANPQSSMWTVPRVNVTGVRLNVTVADSEGALGYDETDYPDIDSTAPTVVSTLPAADAVEVDWLSTIEVNFSEPMQQVATQGAVGLATAGGVPVGLTFLGWFGNTMLLRPAASLSNDTTYEVTVSTAALDASDPGNPLAAPYTWQFHTFDNAPTASLTAPSAGTSWSGGSSHEVAWSAADANEPASNLTVTVTYSPDGSAPWGALFGPVAGDASPWVWSVPLDDAPAARLNLTVVDRAGKRATAISPPFAVDSTAPTVTSTYPFDGANGVARNTGISVLWDEPMDPTTAAAAVGLQDVGSSAWVPGTVAWSSTGDELFFTPTSPLSPNAAYRLVVNGTALDASDPGNAAGVDRTFAFNTTASLDASPPAVQSASADPATQGPGLAVELTVNATDDTGVGSIWANLTGPGGVAVSNTSLAAAGAGVWNGSVSSTLLGLHTVSFWVCDQAGNCVTATATFTIADILPPTLSDLQSTPAHPTVPGSATLSATVSDDSGVAAVWFVLGTQNLTATYDAAAGRYAATFELAGVGTLPFTVGARDAAGNVGTAAGALVAYDDLPPQLSFLETIPPLQELGGDTALSADASDNVAVTGVWAIVDGSTNLTMTPSGTSPGTFTATVPSPTVGAHTFVVWATDASGHPVSASGTFEVQDTVAPTLEHAPVTTAGRASEIPLNATAHDLGGVAGVYIAYTGTNGRDGNVSAAATGGDGWAAAIPGQTLSGNLTYSVLAVDGSGNWVSVGPFTVSIPADVVPEKGEDPTLLYEIVPHIAALVVADGALAGWLFVRRRRQRAAPDAAGAAEASSAPMTRAMASLFVVAGLAGIVLLTYDQHLWDEGTDHAWALVGFTVLHFAMAGALAFRPERFTHAGALWGAGQAALMAADVITAPEYGHTYSQFAVYLFSQWEFLTIMGASIAAFLVGNHLVGGLGTTLRFWKAIPAMLGGSRTSPPPRDK